MTWILLALIGPAFWAASNLVDEHLIKRMFPSALGYIALTGIFFSLPAAWLFLFGNVGKIDPVSLLLSGLAGALWLLLLVPYLAAMRRTDAATVTPLWNISTIAIVVIAVAFLHEPLTSRSLGAIALLMLSALVASYLPRMRKAGAAALGFMTLASFLYATEAIAEKVLFERVGYQTGFAYLSLGALATGLVILLFSREARAAIRSNMSSRLSGIIGLNELLNQTGIICSATALSLGPVSLVRAIGGLSPIYILLMTVVWTALRPKTTITRLTKSLVVRVIVSVSLAVAGLALIQTTL